MDLEVLFGKPWSGWRSKAAFTGSLIFLVLLGFVRVATNAELALASFALLPILLVAWVTSRRAALFVSFFAAIMWIVSDIVSDQDFSAPWVPYLNGLTRFVTYSVIVLLATQVRVQMERERDFGTHDFLTGLDNRRSFMSSGDAEVARSVRYAHSLAVVFIDLDDFKQLNDSRGHTAGDEALKATATALLGALRSSDQVARLGGDEFAILLPEVNYVAAMATGSKVRAAINRAMLKFPPVTSSVGVAWFASVDRTFSEMLNASDALMYEIKSEGKNNLRTKNITEHIEPHKET